jgi:hypothetical protein
MFDYKYIVISSPIEPAMAERGPFAAAHSDAIWHMADVQNATTRVSCVPAASFHPIRAMSALPPLGDRTQAAPKSDGVVENKVCCVLTRPASAAAFFTSAARPSSA